MLSSVLPLFLDSIFTSSYIHATLHPLKLFTCCRSFFFIRIFHSFRYSSSTPAVFLHSLFFLAYHPSLSPIYPAPSITPPFFFLLHLILLLLLFLILFLLFLILFLLFVYHLILFIFLL